MAYRLKVQVVLKSGDHLTIHSPITFKAGTKDKRAKKKADVIETSENLIDMHRRAKRDGLNGWMHFNDWTFDVQDIAGLSIVPQRHTLFGWKDLK